jgi:hypothetical protein
MREIKDAAANANKTTNGKFSNLNISPETDRVRLISEPKENFCPCCSTKFDECRSGSFGREDDFSICDFLAAALFLFRESRFMLRFRERLVLWSR